MQGMASKETQKEPEPEGKRHHVSFHTAGLVAELYPSHTQKQKKLGPIGRKKLQSHEQKKKLLRSVVRKRRLGLLESNKDDGNGQRNLTHAPKEGSNNDGLERSDEMEADGLAEKADDEMSVSDSKSPLDGLTGIPLESVWFGMGGKKKAEDEGNGGVGISQSVLQVSVE